MLSKNLTYEMLQDKVMGPLIKKKFFSQLYQYPEQLTVNKSLEDPYCVTLKFDSKRQFEKYNQYTMFNFGYGGMKYRIGGHVLACMIYYGPSNGLFALHKCDTPFCCNKNHLYWGTSKNNVDDKNERNITSKDFLSRYQVESIRYYANYGYTYRELGIYFNRHLLTIFNIIHENNFKYRTDGSEILPDPFIPIKIPPSYREIKIRKCVLLGEKLEAERYNIGHGTWCLFCKNKYNITSVSAGKYIRLYKYNIHEKYYYFGIGKLIKLMQQKVDLSK